MGADDSQKLLPWRGMSLLRGAADLRLITSHTLAQKAVCLGRSTRCQAAGTRPRAKCMTIARSIESHHLARREYEYQVCQPAT